MPKKRTPEMEVLSPVSDGAASAPSVARTTKTTRARTAAATHKSTAPKRDVKRAAGPVAESTEPVAATPAAVSEEEIARLAYSYWEARGYTGGSPEEDWYRAERELRLQIRG
ncbi:MAG: DUF2934 domain-containing protein [Bryobacteraceae bacterium]